MSRSGRPLRVLLADDHTLVRAGIRALLEKMPDVEVVHEAADGRSVLDWVRISPPDVVLMDVTMPGMNGLEAASRLAREFPRVRVLILSMHHNEEYVGRAFKAGAAGYLLKNAATAELATALHRVAAGKRYLSPGISIRLPENHSQGSVPHRTSRLESLTDRQREILQLIAEGRNTKRIAEILQLSPKTVEYHRLKLMACLNVHEVAGLVRFALRVGLISHEH